MKTSSRYGGDGGPNARGKYCVDMVLDWEGELAKSALEKFAKEGKFDEMPDPIKPKTVIEGFGYYMQVSATEKSPKKWDIIKHYTFDEPQKYTFLKERIVQGEMCLMSWWKANTFASKKIFQKVFENLGGFQILFCDWGGEDKADALTDEKRAAGYEYIRKWGPAANNRGEWVEWADRKTHDETTPLFGWPEAKVKEFLGARHRGKQTAKTLTQFFTTYKDLQPWMLHNIMRPIAATHQEFGVIWIGLTQCGKSLVATTHGFQVSIFQLKEGGFDLGEHEPSILTARYLDMFRGEPVTKIKPGIYDDGKFFELDAPEVKAFLYPAEPDATLWARYGGSHFEHHSCRQGVSQQFDKKFEADLSARDNRDRVTDEDFMKIVRPSFTEEADEEDMDAFKRRFHMVMCSPTHVYFRHATRAKVYVPRFKWDDVLQPDLFLPHVRTLYEKVKNGMFEVPAGRHEGIVWSQQFLKLAMRGEPMPRAVTISDRAAGTEVAHHPPLMDCEEAKVRVKEEVWKLAKRSHKVVIDLSPSPQKNKQTRSSASASSGSASASSNAFPPLQSVAMPAMAMPVSPPGDDYDMGFESLSDL